jgi:YHS domain-containing protein
VFTSIQLDYKLVLNVLGVGVFVALFALTLRRGAKDPICGMIVDRSKALNAARAGQAHFFCSEGCRTSFLASLRTPTTTELGAATTDGHRVA